MMRKFDPSELRRWVQTYGLVLLGGAVWGIGVLSAGWTLKAARRAHARCSARWATAHELRRIEERLAPSLAARDAAEKAWPTEPVPLLDLARVVWPRTRPEDVRELGREPAEGTWTLRRVELTWTEAPLERIMELIRQAETAQPPWRIVRCVIQSSPTTPGMVALTLEGESVGREGASPSGGEGSHLR